MQREQGLALGLSLHSLVQTCMQGCPQFGIKISKVGLEPVIEQRDHLEADCVREGLVEVVFGDFLGVVIIIK